MSRVEVLDDSDDEENVVAPPKSGGGGGGAAGKSKPAAPVGPVGPPRPPAGMVLKRVGKNKPLAAATVPPSVAAPAAMPSVKPAGTFSPAAAVAAMRGDPSKPPPVAESDSESDDDSDDLVSRDQPVVFLAFLT